MPKRSKSAKRHRDSMGQFTPGRRRSPARSRSRKGSRKGSRKSGKRKTSLKGRASRLLKKLRSRGSRRSRRSRGSRGCGSLAMDACNNKMANGLRNCRWSFDKKKCQVMPAKYRRRATLGVGGSATYKKYIAPLQTRLSAERLSFFKKPTAYAAPVRPLPTRKIGESAASLRIPTAPALSCDLYSDMSTCLGNSKCRWNLMKDECYEGEELPYMPSKMPPPIPPTMRACNLLSESECGVNSKCAWDSNKKCYTRPPPLPMPQIPNAPPMGLSPRAHYYGEGPMMRNLGIRKAELSCSSLGKKNCFNTPDCQWEVEKQTCGKRWTPSVQGPVPKLSMPPSFYY